jgi:hypothetical protein
LDSKNNLVKNIYNRDRIIVGYFIIVLAAVGLIKIASIIGSELIWVY